MRPFLTLTLSADLLAGTPVKGLPEPPPLGSPRFELSSPRFPLFQPSPKRPPLDSLRSPPTGAPRWHRLACLPH